MCLTVGKVEDLLRKYPKRTEISLSCGCCHRSSMGSEDILKLKDYTNQTYGYIELDFNARSQGSAELNDNEKQWYEGEIIRLKEQIKKQSEIIEIYKNEIETIRIECSIVEKRTRHIEEE